MKFLHGTRVTKKLYMKDVIDFATMQKDFVPYIIEDQVPNGSNMYGKRFIRLFTIIKLDNPYTLIRGTFSCNVDGRKYKAIHWNDWIPGRLLRGNVHCGNVVASK